MMSPETKRKIHLAVVPPILIAAARSGYILYQRHEDALEAARQKKARDVGFSNQDYYVTPKKLYPYDLKSAKQLTLQPVWVKEGYRYTYYPYNPAARRVDFDHDAGLLLPIEKLTIKKFMGAGQAGRSERCP